MSSETIEDLAMNEADRLALRRQARRAGLVRNENTASAARANGAKGGRPKGSPVSTETRAKLAAAQQARRERERLARAANSEAGDGSR